MKRTRKTEVAFSGLLRIEFSTTAGNIIKKILTIKSERYQTSLCLRAVSATEHCKRFLESNVVLKFMEKLRDLSFKSFLLLF